MQPRGPGDMTTLSSLPDGYTAAIFGASGGLGGAFVRLLASDPRCARVHAGARGATSFDDSKVVPFQFDLTDPASLATAAASLGSPDLVIVATGLLHDANRSPEKSLKALDAAEMQRAFAVNTIGPAMIARHVLASAPRDRRMLFAALSAKVGSISDNRLGGWHSYRASKAALNQIIRTLSVELARTHPQCVCVALHPGTVDTNLSRPFQTGVTADKLFSPERAARQLLTVLDSLAPDASGRLIDWDGREILP